MMRDLAASVTQAVVITHGTSPDLERCLTALSPQVADTILVSNLPSDPRPSIPGVRGYVNARPLGFAANVNGAVRQTTSEFVALVNPDAVADAGAIDALVGHMVANPSTGVAAPQLRWPDGRRQPTGRSYPRLLGSMVRRTPLRLLAAPFDHQTAHYRLDTDDTDPWGADWLLGAFMLLRRSVFDDIGGFDDGYPMYVEDMDYCARVNAAGHKCVVVPDATAEHTYQAVIDRHFLTERNWLHLRSMLRFARRHPRLLLRGRGQGR